MKIYIYLLLFADIYGIITEFNKTVQNYNAKDLSDIVLNDKTELRNRLLNNGGLLLFWGCRCTDSSENFEIFLFRMICNTFVTRYVLS